MSETRDGKDLWQWSQVEIRWNAFRRSTIPQKQFIIIIMEKTSGIKGWFPLQIKQRLQRFRKLTITTRTIFMFHLKTYWCSHRVIVADVFLRISLKILKFVANKAKGRISKRVFQENKAHQIFRKTNIFFSENLACFVKIRPFALLPTNWILWEKHWVIIFFWIGCLWYKLGNRLHTIVNKV